MSLVSGDRRRSAGSLTAKVIWSIIVASSALLLVVSSIEILRERQALIEQETRQAEAAVSADLDALALAVWNVDQPALDTMTRGLVRIGSIWFVQVLENGEIRSEARRDGHDLNVDRARELPLMRPRTDQQIGVLRILESYDGVRGRFAGLLPGLVIAEMSKIALIAVVLFIVVRTLITKPLSHVTQQLAKISAEGAGIIHAGRRPTGSHDELDALVDALNHFNTERSRLEAERLEHRRREADASKLEALGRLAAGVAHDFNNILGAIRGYAEFLEEDLPAEAKERRFATRIIAATNRGNSVVRQILTFFRRGESEVVLFELAGLLAEAEDLLRATLPRTTRLHFDNRLAQASVQADKAQLLLAVINLCVNAHDAHDSKDGHVVVEVERFEPSRAIARPSNSDNAAAARAVAEVGIPYLDDSGAAALLLGAWPVTPAVSITVRDEGSGMSPEMLGRVFDPFFTTKEIGRGTGLGLPLVRKIVEDSGGCLAVRSRQGGGTIFQIVLPLAGGQLPPAQTATATKRGQGEAGASIAILVVDDDPDFCLMTATALRRLGHEVHSEEDPAAALALIEGAADRWELLISDQNMPQMTGTELIRAVKQLRPDLPCILCSGDALLPDIGGPGSADARIRKPLAFDALAALILQLVIDHPQHQPWQVEL